MPADWPRRRLGEVLRLEYGKSLPQRARRPGDVAVVGSAGVVGQHSQALLEGPGIVVGRKGSIGKVTWVANDFYPIDTTYFVDPVDGEADLRWAYHTLTREDLSRLNRATGIPGLNRDDVHALVRPIPPLPEQRAIAAVLDAIDDAIERTEAVIAATEELRRALLHELLTRGVPGWHSEWKQVPGLGTVPACWDVTTLGEVCDHITKGATPTTFGHAWAEEANGGHPFLRSECVGDGEFIPSGLAWITLKARASLSRSHVRGGDVLMTITGYVGRVCRLPGEFGDADINQHIARIRVRSGETVKPEFAFQALRHPRIESILRGEITGIAYPQIGLAQVRALRIPVPSEDEQNHIVGALGAVDAELAALGEEVSASRGSKESLADALLTGRVRTRAMVPG